MSIKPKLNIGNRLENLIELLAMDFKSNPLPSPFLDEYILIQTAGMEQWISFKLAEANGCSVNIKYITPAGLVSLVEKAIPTEISSSYDKKAAAWGIMKLLNEGLLENKEFEKVKSYVNADQVRLFQISSKIADLFDQYAIYRQDILRDWKSKKLHYNSKEEPLLADIEKWQRTLFLEFDSKFSDSFGRFTKLESLLQENFIKEKLPSRISVFGMSVLSQYHFSLLEKLSDYIDINYYLLNPCKYYWGDIQTEKEFIKKNLKLNFVEGYEGNVLLASMGKLGRDFFEMLYENSNEYIYNDETDFLNVDPACDDKLTMLKSIQSDIYNLQNHETSKSKFYASSDTSIRIVSCHTKMRELETLHDYLLDLFNHDETLNASQALVMTPNIDEYASYIDAVFGTRGEDHYIPYSIADKKFISYNRAADVLISILDLMDSRFTFSQVIELLGFPVILKKFDLEQDDLEFIKEILNSSGIRWGIDAKHRREKFEVFSGDEFTWKFGLNRILLSFAANSKDEELYHNTAAIDNMDTETINIMGKFIRFADNLFEIYEKSALPKSILEWKNFLMEIIDSFIKHDDSSEKGLMYVKRQIDFMDKIHLTVNPDFNIEFDVIKIMIKDRFDEPLKGRGFMRNGVTFCSMIPMRSIPFRVICMLGMNDSKFPSKTSFLGYDLMALDPRRGDRNIRESDRYLFLESILSARDKLYISFWGQSIKDNSEILHSSVVDELLDYMKKICICDNPNGQEEKEKKDFKIKKKMQGFNPIYFDETNVNFYSYRNDFLKSAKSFAEKRNDFAPKSIRFKEKIISQITPQEDIIQIDLRILKEFYKNPAKYFYNKTLSVYLDDNKDVDYDRELIEPNSLENYNVQDEILKTYLLSKISDENYLKAASILPAGVFGSAAFKAAEFEAKAIADQMLDQIGSKDKTIVSERLKIDNYEIFGTVNNLYEDRLIKGRSSTVKANDRLDLWIEHVFLSALGKKVSGIYIGTDESIEYAEMDVRQAEKILLNLITLYILGLKELKAFFPKSSFEYYKYIVEAEENKKNRKNEEDEVIISKALSKALSKWKSDYNDSISESDDTYYSDAFNKINLEEIYKEFEKLSELVFDKMLRYSRSSKADE
jgi:exodeoxyribonuclease V gamma subunit